MTATFTRSEIETGRKLFAGDWQFVAAAGSAIRLPPMKRRRDRLCRPLQCRQVEPDQRADRAQGAGAHLEHAGPHPGADLLPRRRPAHAGRHAGLRPRRGVEGEDRGLDRADRGVPARPRQPRARLCAGRCAARPQGRSTTQVLKALGAAAVSHQVVLTKTRGDQAVGARGAGGGDRGRADEVRRGVSRP